MLFAGGSPPDIWGEGGPVSDWAMAGMLLDLTRYVERDADELNVDDFSGRLAQRHPLGQSDRRANEPLHDGHRLQPDHLSRQALRRPCGLDKTRAGRGKACWRTRNSSPAGSADGKVIHYGFDIWRGTEYFLPWVQGFGGDYFDRAAYDSGLVEESNHQQPGGGRPFQSSFS